MVRAALYILLVTLAFAPPASAQHCRLALLLALDISSSVDVEEDRLQRHGLANALIAPEVVEALLDPGGHVALAAYEWSGRYQQDPVLNWTVLDTPAAILLASETIRNSQRSYGEFPTAAGYALSHAVVVFKEAPTCDRQTLDVSGDGVNNDGYSPVLVHKNRRMPGVTVNGLAIGGATNTFGDNNAELMLFFRNEVINGPGSFVEFAKDYVDFERAMKRKLIREVTTLNLTNLDISR